MNLQSMMRRVGVISAAAVAGMAVSAAAGAGPRYGVPGVTIEKNADGSGRFYGTLGGTRNSANTVERLGCTITRFETDPSGPNPARTTIVSCNARDKNNVSVICTTSNDALGDALDGLANDGLLDFRWNANGACTDITVYESSSLERKR